MNFEMSKSSEKGKDVIKLIISPSDNLEKEFFNSLFTNKDVKVEAIPNSDEIVIKPKESTN